MLNIKIQQVIYNLVQSLFENGLWKAIIATFLSLFAVPLKFVVALPLFWFLDFCAGLWAARKEAKESDEEDVEWFDEDKMRSQFVKIAIHITFLVGCVAMANTFEIQQFIIFGFGYIIGNEFIFSTIPHLFGDKKAVKVTERLGDILTGNLGIDISDEESNSG